MERLQLEGKLFCTSVELNWSLQAHHEEDARDGPLNLAVLDPILAKDVL